jgi:hypothetical protein
MDGGTGGADAHTAHRNYILAGFGIFALLLWWNSLPGERLDAAASVSR